MKTNALALILVFFGLSGLPFAEEWRQFRGPGYLGVAPDGAGLPDTWSERKNVAWKAPVAGMGWSCPVVWGDRVFLTTAINAGKTEAPKPGLYFGGERGKPTTVHAFKVLCYDLESGEQVWEYLVHKGVPPEARHVKNSFASETPVTDGRRLYAYIGNIGLFTFNRDGKLLWARSWDPVKTRHGWGTAASPAVHKDVVYILNDNEGPSWLTALDAATGDMKWRIDRDEGSNWSTPFVWQNSKRTEIVTTGTGRVRSYNLDGRLLWTLSGFSSITVPTPFAKDDLLYIGSGYVGDQKRPFMAIKPGAQGDISLDRDAGETRNAFVAWSHPKIAPYMPTPVLYRDKLYVLLDRGMLSCFDAKTGTQFYDRERLGRLGGFNASPIACDGSIFCFSERGHAAVVKAGENFEIARVNELDEMIMATPAVAGDRLLIRTTGHLYCIREGAGSAALESPPSGRKKAAAKPLPAPEKRGLAGKWNTLAKTDRGDSRGQIEFVASGNGYKGLFAGGGEFKVLKAEGRDVRFEFPFGEGTVVVSAVRTDGKLAGRWTYYDASDLETASDTWTAERAE